MSLSGLALGSYASSRWTFRQESTLVYVQHESVLDCVVCS